jgi:hypothetical protein
MSVRTGTIARMEHSLAPRSHDRQAVAVSSVHLTIEVDVGTDTPEYHDIAGIAWDFPSLGVANHGDTVDFDADASGHITHFVIKY